VVSVEKPWEKPFKDREEARSALGPMGLMFHICNWLGIAFAVFGVVSEVMNMNLGLEPTSWLLLSIATSVAGIPAALAWAVAMHLLGIEGKSKKEG